MAFPVPAFLKKNHHDVYPAIDPTREQLSAAGKFVVVTGGGSGIGPRIAEAFAKAGAAKIALLGRTERTLLSTKQSLEDKYPAKVFTYVADVVQEAAVNEAFRQMEAVGPIDVLVNNAGYLPDKLDIVSSDVEQWWTAYNINVKGALLVTRAFLKNSASDAVLINIATGLSYIPPMAGFSAYSSSKLASSSFFEHLQFEKPALRVFNLHPGLVGTAMGQKALADFPEDGKAFDTREFPPMTMSRCSTCLHWCSSAVCALLGLAGKS
jgi:NAD(P)-dependent dehydrogenase (short-subunit alcohol dehydrogenase family)